MSTAAVVIAAGYGSLRVLNGAPFPKLLEVLGDKPMVVHALDAVRDAGLSPCILVVNPRDGRLVAQAVCDAGHADVQLVPQRDRRGTVDAFLRATDFLPDSCTSALVTYGDMPLWKPEQMRRLVQAHRAHHAVTMLTVSASHPDCPRELRRYGVVYRDGQGRVCSIVEPNGLRHMSSEVNPSLWVWDVSWFKANASHAPRMDKRDGHGPEFPLPGLLPQAYTQGRTIGVVSLDRDHWTALGVNTEAELEMARRIIRRTLSA